ncbi:unnamed protein product, partial [Urochloa humidicola]
TSPGRSASDPLSRLPPLPPPLPGHLPFSTQTPTPRCGFGDVGRSPSRARALRLAGAAASRVGLASDELESLGAAVHEQLVSASPAMGSSPSLPCPPPQIHAACRSSPSHCFLARPQPPNRICHRFHLCSPLISARAAHLPSPALLLSPPRCSMSSPPDPPPSASAVAHDGGAATRPRRPDCDSPRHREAP